MTGVEHEPRFRTYAGRMVLFLHPSPADIIIEDVAHHLAAVARFGGATDVPYSVASHSVYVSRRLADEGYDYDVQLAGLLHDAPEAYLGDVVSGLKGLLGGYRELEARWAEAVEHAYGVRFQHVEAIKRADVRARLAEARDLFGGRFPLGTVLTGVAYRHLTPYAAPVVPESAADAEWAFLQRAAELGVLLDAGLQ